MKQIIQVKHFVLGKGMVKICVPIVANNIAQLKQQCFKIKELPCELVEIRIDYFSSIASPNIKKAFKITRDMLPDKAIIATFRSLKEGGEKACDDISYHKIYEVLLKEQLCDVIDLEASRPIDITNSLQEIARRQHIYTILSSHNFVSTPSFEKLLLLMDTMAKRNPDIIKVAVMPNRKDDVRVLMEATNVMNERLLQPLITMAMGELGQISRSKGECFGSCMTFASAEKASAPGQIPCREIKKLLEEVHETLRWNS